MFEHRSHAQRGTLAHSGARSSGWAWGFVWSATLALGWPVPSGAGIALQSELNLSSSPAPSAVTEVTPQGLAVDPDGRVIAVQVYPHRDEQTQAPVMEGLMIRKDGQMFRARADGTSEILPRS